MHGGGLEQVGRHGRDLLGAKVKGIVVERRKLTKEIEIKEEVVNAFQDILLETGDWGLSISRLSFFSLDSVDAGLLEKAFFLGRDPDCTL
ncbi:hypothetical protein CK203_103509 [Vitis vinifera]|uniref:Uncharacterized protein n=1 Tax=Vitis vinifera TaxID=29760 RepID=A0A438CQN7_VITVI|nr:hypothetical protein CK203_103509 [Vitis vinifera]